MTLDKYDYVLKALSVYEFLFLQKLLRTLGRLGKRCGNTEIIKIHLPIFYQQCTYRQALTKTFLCNSHTNATFLNVERHLLNGHHNLDNFQVKERAAVDGY